MLLLHPLAPYPPPPPPRSRCTGTGRTPPSGGYCTLVLCSTRPSAWRTVRMVRTTRRPAALMVLWVDTLLLTLPEYDVELEVDDDVADDAANMPPGGAPKPPAPKSAPMGLPVSGLKAGGPMSGLKEAPGKLAAGKKPLLAGKPPDILCGCTR